jgi:tetratricopeptide (TPR) repeat protein
MQDPASELLRIPLVGDSVNNFGQVSSGFIQDSFVSVLVKGGSLKAASTAGSSRMSEEQKSRETARQNEVSQEGTEPKRTDVERVEEAAQAIVRAIETGSDRFWEAQVEAQQKATKPKNRLVGTMLFVASTWVVFFAIVTLCTLLVGWIVFETSPLHSLERIAHEQQQQVREEKQTKARRDLGTYFVNLGDRLLLAGKATAAKDEFKTALELDPLNREAQMGVLKCELFESVAAEAYDPAAIRPKLDKLAEERPNDTHVHAFRGTVHVLLGKYDAARSDFEKAVSLNPSNAYAHDGLGDVYYGTGKFEKYLEQAKKANALAPWDPTYQYSYANALYVTGRYEDAIREYSDNTRLDPQFILSYHDLAQLYRLRGDLELSHWYYEQAIVMLEDKEIASLAKNQATFVFYTGPDSYPVYLTEESDKRSYVYYGIGLTAYLAGHEDKAANYVNKAKEIQSNPDMGREVKRLMEYDVKLLQAEQQWLSKQANDFSKKYLTQSNPGL